MRSPQEKKFDELYESIVVLMDELAIRHQQLKLQMAKYGRPVISAEAKVLLESKITLPSPNEIALECCKIFTVTEEELYAKNKGMDKIVSCRWIALNLVHKYWYPSLNLKDIGMCFGRDHSTVINALTQHKERLLHDAEYQRMSDCAAMRVAELANKFLTDKTTTNG